MTDDDMPREAPLGKKKKRKKRDESTEGESKKKKKKKKKAAADIMPNDEGDAASTASVASTGSSHATQSTLAVKKKKRTARRDMIEQDKSSSGPVTSVTPAWSHWQREDAEMVPRIQSRFVEEYDAHAGRRSLEALMGSHEERRRRIEQLEEARKRRKKQHDDEQGTAEACEDAEARVDHETTSTAEDEILRNCRRASECMRWIDAFLKVGRPTPDGRRLERVVDYERKKLVHNGLEWGRRYVRCAERVRGEDTGARVKLERLGLQGAPRAVRDVLCASVYRDCDMVNSFPNIARCLARHYGLLAQMPVLDAYACDEVRRNELLARIGTHHGICNRDHCKRLPITLLHGGTYRGWMLSVCPPKTEPLQDVMAFATEIQRLMRAVFDSPRPIERDIRNERPHIISGANGSHHVQYTAKGARRIVPGRRDNATEGGVAEVDRTMFSYVMQSYEDRLLRIVAAELEAEGWAVGSLQFDGLYVRPTASTANTSASLREAMDRAERGVKRVTDGLFEVKLKEKELYGKPIDDVLESWATAHLQVGN